MAKKQTFTDKVGKDNKKFKFVKYIQTLFSEESGGVKFLSRMLRLEENENIDQALKREEESSKFHHSQMILLNKIKKPQTKGSPQKKKLQRRSP
ncbi:MAG: hypothetical protein Ct9H90mP15_02380 [Candidatus Neomarinimicrobiota bacterium]|nr:MAG: hypothetical protein Ct9H90mP15_02380 [Candidatus Neomarinimicrobiota bacterium]